MKQAKGKDLFLFIFMMGLALIVLNLFREDLESTRLKGSLFLLLVVSVVLNLAVILYHYNIPAHPKFLILPKRKWTIRLHVWSGTVELVSGVLAVFFLSPQAALIQAVMALFIHVPTALLQTPIVFGSKAIMIPSYLLCIFIHAFCAFNLLLDPTSHSWAINTFLIFNIYAWCRFYFYFLDRFHLFGSEKYSVSILFAGLTIIPALFGALSLIILVSYISVFIVLVKLFFIHSPEQYSRFVHERSRDALLSNDFIKKNVKSSDISSLQEESERDKAEYVFKLIDFNNDGIISRVELEELLSEWGLSKNEVDDYFIFLGSNQISFDLFFHQMEPVWRYIFFDILRALDVNESTEMIGRSLESLRSRKKVTDLKKDIEISLLKKTTFFKDAEENLIRDLAASLTKKEFKKSEVLFCEGDHGDRFYLIEAGEVSVFKSNEYITTLTPGACFGEIALIDERARTATVIADSECVLFCLSKTSFEYVLSTFPHFREELISLIKARQG